MSESNSGRKPMRASHSIAASASGGPDLVGHASEIVRAYVSRNPLGATAIPEFIAAVHATLAGLGQPAAPCHGAVPVSRSVTPDHLICLEDGKMVKSLKSHLARLGLTPDSYRKKWGLPADYPMVAPKYSLARSQIAKRNRLGQKKQGLSG